jgi:hypothetical protein
MDYQKRELPKKISTIGLSLTVVGGLLIILSFIFQTERALYNYLIMFMFIASIGLGSLAFVAIEYMAGAIWSTPFRRIAEFLSAPIPLLLILVIPIILGANTLYHWTNINIVSNDPILQGKSSYLNLNFFIIRIAICIFIWILFYYLITKNSKLQDTNNDVKYTKNNIKLSVVFAPVFIITLTFAAIDLMMSLEPHWYSTIYGIYYFAGTLVAGIASFALVTIFTLEGKFFDSRINNKHLHSVGILLFAFNIFWAYIAFSQYLLIWYANLPEENYWFLNRMNGSWVYLSLGMVFIHFIIPFLVLIPSYAKTNLKTLKVMSIWLLAAHYLDLYWLVMPTYDKSGIVFGWVEIGFPVAAVGIIILLFKFKSRNNNLMPIGDPKLEGGINLTLYPDLSID